MNRKFLITVIVLTICTLLTACGSTKENNSGQMLHILESVEAPAQTTMTETEVFQTTETTIVETTTEIVKIPANVTEAATTKLAASTTTAKATEPAQEEPKSDLDIYKEESIAKIQNDKPELDGIDISEYQAGQTWKQYIDESDAVFLRYSAGTSKDTCFDTFVEYAKQHHKLIGIYFYTNPVTWSNLTPQEYAQWCYDNTKDYIGYAIYALDCEAGRLDTQWILEYLREFKALTGVKPVIYTGQYRLNEAAEDEALQTIRSESYGLWIARYGQNDGEVYDFEVFLWEENKVFGHQYVSAVEHLDRDKFFCTAEAWYKYAQPNK